MNIQQFKKRVFEVQWSNDRSPSYSHIQVFKFSITFLDKKWKKKLNKYLSNKRKVWFNEAKTIEWWTTFKEPFEIAHTFQIIAVTGLWWFLIANFNVVTFYSRIELLLHQHKIKLKTKIILKKKTILNERKYKTSILIFCGICNLMG